MNASKRKFLALSGLTIASTLYGNTSDKIKQKEESTSTNKNSPLANSSNPRVVVVGGGWSGLSIAKTIKEFSPQADLILVESRHEFISCPVSNLWIVDKVDLDYITHDYLQAARNYGYTFFNATATDIDKKNRLLKTTQGEIMTSG